MPHTSATTIPAPIGGLNDRDAIADMPPTDAVIMKNWWPEPSRVSVRKGSITHASGLSGGVESVFEYCSPLGTIELFAAAAGEIFDVTTSGEVGLPVVTGQTSDRYQTMAATTAGGSFLYAFNGADEPLLYDGTDWKPINDTSTPSITGITDTKTIIDGLVFKGRAYLIQKNSMNFWYLPPAQIGGEAVAIDMGQIFQRGGHIVTAKTWTIDSGNGSDDHMVVISSNGEVAVFSGYDPSTPGAWSLIGVFYLGRPIGQRCAIKFGGDLLIICEDGVFPLGRGLLSASVDRRVAVTDKIQNRIRQAANTYKSTFGWELCLASDHSAVILNVPGQMSNKQYAQNTLTGAWAEFEGWDANCWLYSELGLFYGGDGAVYRAWDFDSDDGEAIEADCLQAFNHFGTKVQTKYFTMIRPYIATGGIPSILYSLNGDYSATDPEGALITRPPQGMLWGSMVWGSMVWGGSLQQVQDWLTVGGIYKSAGLRMKVLNNQSPVQWAATDFIYSRGGLL
ncbi:hypothetical protein RE432_18305 [Pusillimonas sp. SM2304]|uniref:hypothetical protein n=1 Tax=Pusillimonas sp. SM2304 TaxID=3073241 RepID=UPI002873FF67|nr:hypothetical protein [Pusillimonas sp. SM2304]MDS1142390.1 hypothetical protein [Pusillimonas sp. SM2304]